MRFRIPPARAPQLFVSYALQFPGVVDRCQLGQQFAGCIPAEVRAALRRRREIPAGRISPTHGQLALALAETRFSASAARKWLALLAAAILGSSGPSTVGCFVFRLAGWRRVCGAGRLGPGHPLLIQFPVLLMPLRHTPALLEGSPSQPAANQWPRASTNFCRQSDITNRSALAQLPRT